MMVAKIKTTRIRPTQSGRGGKISLKEYQKIQRMMQKYGKKKSR